MVCVGAVDALAELIGTSPALGAVRDRIRRLITHQADSRRPPAILIQGETGTGKGLVAHGIHRAGPRARGPFVDVNCAAIPETLLEAEMFGFQPGAFTDARHGKPGLFQLAHRGVLFLDEVGLLPERLQGKLLNALEERAVRRLGGTRSEPADVWVIAATSENLRVATQARRFREDLYHRLAVATLELPPLRERGEDILLLAEHFLRRTCDEYGLPPKTLSGDAREALLRHRWPGNVRELANVLERAVLFTEAPVVTAPLLDLAPLFSDPSDGDQPGTLDRAIRDRIAEALSRNAWNISRAAADLGISRLTLRKRIARHRIHRPLPASRGRPAGAARLRPAPSPARPRPPDSGSVHERRHLTLMRVSTASEAVATRVLNTCRDLVPAFGGRVEAGGPGGLVAVFGLEPSERSAVWAVRCALAIQERARRTGAGGADQTIARIALHAGQFVLARAGTHVQLDLEGARDGWTVLESLRGVARPGDIVLSEEAASLVDRRFTLERVQDPARASRAAYRITGAEQAGFGPTGRVTPFFGRERELELIRKRLEVALAGRGQVIGIMGEPGIGKSRLLFEFRRHLEETRVRYLEGWSAAHAKGVPYFPLAQMVRRGYAIGDGGPVSRVPAQVRSVLDEAGLTSEEDAPYLLQLLGAGESSPPLDSLSAETVRARTFDVFRRLLVVRQRPLVIALEDLHWADSTSVDCLASLVNAMTATPVLVICTYRPGYHAPWMDKSYATQIAIPPLDDGEARMLLRSVLNRSDLPESTVRALLERGEGNPLFLEELARDFEETGGSAAIPDSLWAAVAARINRLGEAPRHLLEVAAVVGREAPAKLFRAVAKSERVAAAHLRRLERQELLYQDWRGGELVHVFKHALTQEIAYASLDAAARRAVHLATARALEALHAGRLEDVYDRLAYHYSRSLEAAKAVGYLTAVAERAARGYAHAEAVAALGEALQHAEHLPREERDRRVIETALRQSESLHFLGRFEEIRELLARLEERLAPLGDPALSGRYHFRLGLTASLQSRNAEALAHARRALDEGRRAGDKATMGKAHWVMGYEARWQGQPLRGAEHARLAIEFLMPTDERWWLAMAEWLRGWNELLLGDYSAALEGARRVHEIADELGDRRLEVFAALHAARAHTFIADYDVAIREAEHALANAPDPLATANALGVLGYAFLERGDIDQAVPLFERASALMTQFEFHRGHVGFTLPLALAYVRRGDLARADAVVAREQELLEQHGAYAFGVALAREAAGHVLRARGRLDEAEAELSEALAMFEEARSPFEVGRVHLLLAEIASVQRDRDAAARHLATALAVFRDLGLTKREAQVERLAEELGVPSAALAT